MLQESLIVDDVFLSRDKVEHAGTLNKIVLKSVTMNQYHRLQLTVELGVPS
jgi:hypothetical protein